MRRYREPILVHAKNNRPLSLSWRNRHIKVDTVQDRWIARSRWWSRDETRLYLRLHTGHGIMEIYRSEASWFISRIAD
jgi:hypothetical protein